MITESNRKHVLVGAELLGLTAEALRCPRMPPGRMRWTRRSLEARVSPGEAALQMFRNGDIADSSAPPPRSEGRTARLRGPVNRKELTNVAK